MVSQKTMLIAVLVATLAVFGIVMSIGIVLGLLITSKTVPSSGIIELVAWVFRISLPTLT